MLLLVLFHMEHSTQFKKTKLAHGNNMVYDFCYKYCTVNHFLKLGIGAEMPPKHWSTTSCPPVGFDQWHHDSLMAPLVGVLCLPPRDPMVEIRVGEENVSFIIDYCMQ